MSKAPDSRPAIHRLAYAFLRAERAAIMAQSAMTASRAVRARLAWARQGCPMLEGETHGSAPPRVIARLEEEMGERLSAVLEQLEELGELEP